MSAEDVFLSISTFVAGIALSLLIGWLHVVVERRAIATWHKSRSDQMEARRRG